MSRYKKRQCAHDITRYKQNYQHVHKQKFNYDGNKNEEEVKNVGIFKFTPTKDRCIADAMLTTLARLNFILGVDHYYSVQMRFAADGEELQFPQMYKYVVKYKIIGADGTTYHYPTPNHHTH